MRVCPKRVVIVSTVRLRERWDGILVWFLWGLSITRSRHFGWLTQRQIFLNSCRCYENVRRGLPSLA